MDRGAWRAAVHWLTKSWAWLNDLHFNFIFPSGTVGKESGCNVGDPGSGRSPREGHDNPLQYSCLEHLRDRGAWGATVYGMAQSLT